MKNKHLALIVALIAALAVGPLGLTPAVAQHARGPHRGPVYGRGYSTYRPRSYGYGYGYGPRYVAPRSYYYGNYGVGLYGGLWGYGYSGGYGPYYGSSYYYSSPGNGYGYSTYGGYCR